MGISHRGMLGSGYIQLSPDISGSLTHGLVVFEEDALRTINLDGRDLSGDPSKTVSKFSVVKWPILRDQM